MTRITAIETIIPSHVSPSLMLLRIHTDDGLVGCGETYYTPHGIASIIHDWMAERLLGADALAIEGHWRFLYERSSAFGAPGAELRAISAIDVALWDILGQVCGQPVYRLLGGPVCERIPVYNTCGGPTYGVQKKGAGEAAHPGWPGHGDVGEPGPLQDNWSAHFAAGDLAEELLSEGITAMKLWPFDRYAHEHGGLRISWADVEEGMKPFREIRDRVGMKMEVILEGHAFFQLPAATRIADAMREVQPLWLEDVIRVDSVQTLADFRHQTRMPIAASEMLFGRRDYLQLLEASGADFVMIDPTWSGGISETVRIAQLAQAYNVPVTMHDCTGPFTLLAGMHVAAAVPCVTFQETVRAHIRSFYEELIDASDIADLISDGHAALPQKPGIGTTLRPELFEPGVNSYRRTDV